MFKIEISGKKYKQILKADCLYFDDVQNFIQNTLKSLSFFGNLYDTTIEIKNVEE